MLFEGAVRFGHQAQEALNAGDRATGCRPRRARPRDRRGARPQPQPGRRLHHAPPERDLRVRPAAARAGHHRRDDPRRGHRRPQGALRGVDRPRRRAPPRGSRRPPAPRWPSARHHRTRGAMSTITRLTAAEVASAVAELPPMPASISEVIAACDDQDMTVGQLSQVILRDQSLTANLLKLANSAFYGHARRVTTVTEAVVLLGFSAIKSLAISSHTSRLLNGALPGLRPAAGRAVAALDRGGVHRPAARRRGQARAGGGGLRRRPAARHRQDDPLQLHGERLRRGHPHRPGAAHAVPRGRDRAARVRPRRARARRSPRRGASRPSWRRRSAATTRRTRPP